MSDKAPGRMQRLRALIRAAGSRLYNLPYLHPVLRVTGRTARGFARDDGMIMAAAISFYAILSLIPFMLLLMSIAGFVLNNLGDDYASRQALFAQLATTVRAVMPFVDEDFITRLRGLISLRGTYGITGITALLITSGLVFRTLELAFARIFKTRRRRSMVTSQLLFMLFLLALGLVFMLVHYLGVITESLFTAREIGPWKQLEEILSEYMPLRLVATLLIGTLVFLVLLKYFTKERIRLKYLMLGGLVFSLAWMLAVRLFAYYLQNVARFSLLYGSLATLAVVVVWMFYSACVLLLCAEFTFVLQKESGPAPASGVNPRTADPPGP